MGSQSKCSTILEQKKELAAKQNLPIRWFEEVSISHWPPDQGYIFIRLDHHSSTILVWWFWFAATGVPSLVDSSDARTSANIRLLARCLIDGLSILRTRLHPAQTTQLGSQQAWFAFLLRMRKRLPPSRRRVRWHRYVLLSSHCAAESRSCNSCPRSSAEQIWQPAHILRLVPCTLYRYTLATRLALRITTPSLVTVASLSSTAPCSLEQ